jgi:hypothetical protein
VVGSRALFGRLQRNPIGRPPSAGGGGMGTSEASCSLGKSKLTVQRCG